jgi:hypothetical protein
VQRGGLVRPVSEELVNLCVTPPFPVCVSAVAGGAARMLGGFKLEAPGNHRTLHRSLVFQLSSGS